MYVPIYPAGGNYIQFTQPFIIPNFQHVKCGSYSGHGSTGSCYCGSFYCGRNIKLVFQWYKDQWPGSRNVYHFRKSNYYQYR